jgi:O-acetyl-ADP-ribose deacetylase (regulator of RNase III)
MWQGNVTHLETDAIVNAANSGLRGGGGGKKPNIM